MQSPYKRVIVYDLETGGLSNKHNSITELAMVAIELETLSIIEEFSVMLRPRLDLSSREPEPMKEAKELFKMLKVKDEETNMNTLPFMGHQVTLKNLQPLVDEIVKFYEFLEEHGDIIELEDFLRLEQDTDLGPITKVFFDKCYNPQALEVTHISRDMLIEEGAPYEEAFKLTLEMIKRHTIGNSKPIIAGHNIGSLPRRIVKGKEKGPDGFDNPFMEKFFLNNKSDFFDVINDKIVDTLKEARMRWYELSGYNLGICANEVGLTLKEAHRALPDTVANAKFYIKLLKNLRGEGSQETTYQRRKFDFKF